jgi:spermidine synthase
MLKNKLIISIASIMLFFSNGSFAIDMHHVELKPIHLEKSLYRDISVSESADADIRCMGFEFVKVPNMMVLSFTKLLLAGLYLNPHPKKVLVIGLGIGTLPKAFAKLYSDVTVDTVEIDPIVFKLAKEYFNLKETDQSHVFIEDGRMYVKRAIKEGVQYDMVILDAFNGDYIPEHMLTKEFLEEVKQILTPAGVMATNTFSRSGLYPNESATYEAVFGPFYNLKQDKGNRIIVAQKNGIPPLENVLANAVALEDAFNQFGVPRDWLFPYFISERDWPADARILTDQYSPANLLNTQKP